jgi:hypothetical protein
LRNKSWEREKFKAYLSGDIRNYGRERDASLSRGRERKINFFFKKRKD